MKVVQINVNCNGGSIGKIAVAVSRLLAENGIENYILYALGTSDYHLGIKYTTKAIVKLETLLSKVSGRFGFTAYVSTRRLLKQLDTIKPDIVHLHNIHNHNVHVGMLFKYLKKNDIKVFWTFHDCFAFTGYCMYFDMCRCEKWKRECNNCPQYRTYSFFSDKSKKVYQMKQKAYEGCDLTIITPSEWLAKIVRQSMLRNQRTEVIHNGIDLSVFQYRSSNLREKLGINDRYVVLGVAYNWEKRKGTDVFLRLANDLDSRYQIVLVGTNEDVDKKLPANIISIHKTADQGELAELYSMADVFAMPTREDNYPTVNMEAIACGTPVITYDTGGSPEMVDCKTGTVVPKDNYEMFKQAIIEACEAKKFKREDCFNKAQRDFSDKKCFVEYMNLYTAKILDGD